MGCDTGVLLRHVKHVSSRSKGLQRGTDRLIGRSPLTGTARLPVAVGVIPLDATGRNFARVLLGAKDPSILPSR